MEESFFTFPRAKILTTIKNNKDLTMEHLVQLTGISRGNVKHHLDILKKRKLITITPRQKDLRGKPSFINLTDKADPLSLEVIQKFEALAKIFKASK